MGYDVTLDLVVRGLRQDLLRHELGLLGVGTAGDDLRSESFADAGRASSSASVALLMSTIGGFAGAVEAADLACCGAAGVFFAACVAGAGVVAAGAEEAAVAFAGLVACADKVGAATTAASTAKERIHARITGISWTGSERGPQSKLRVNTRMNRVCLKAMKHA
jgi:hypothetical protein